MQKKNKKIEESGIRSKAYLCVVTHTKGSLMEAFCLHLVEWKEQQNVKVISSERIRDSSGRYYCEWVMKLKNKTDIKINVAKGLLAELERASPLCVLFCVILLSNYNWSFIIQSLTVLCPNMGMTLRLLMSIPWFWLNQR
jgi:hypothetical protein